MSLHLFSLDHLPARLPIWELILEDLGRPPAARVAQALDLGVSTVYRYNQAGQAPKSVCLALFWLTRWGRSAVHAQAVNDALVACSYVDALRREVAAQRLLLDEARRLGYLAGQADPLGTPR